MRTQSEGQTVQRHSLSSEMEPETDACGAQVCVELFSLNQHRCLDLP